MSENISVLEFVFVLVSLYTHTRKILVIVHSLSLSSTLPITVTRFLPVTDNDPSYVYCFLRCPCVVVAVVPFLPAAVAARSTFYSSLHVKKTFIHRLATSSSHKMAFRGLTLLLATFAFYNCAVMGATDCTLPWLVDKNPFISKIESISINRCPTPIVGDQSKEYCCYNTEGKVECCDFQEFLVFGLICLLPIIIILLILSSILSCICCLCCPCCAIYKRRQAGRVLVLQPSSTNYVIIEGIPTVLPNHQSYYASASSGFKHLIPNEYPKQF